MVCGGMMEDVQGLSVWFDSEEKGTAGGAGELMSHAEGRDLRSPARGGERAVTHVDAKAEVPFASASQPPVADIFRCLRPS